MACTSCKTSNGLPKGCNNNGACGTEGCGKLSVFDWLANMDLPNGQEKFNFVEVRFKNDRKFYYKNENNISLNVGDVIAVEGTSGHDIGIVTLTGELVRIQMKKKNLSWTSEDVKKIYRKANQKDIEIWQEFRNKEKQTMIESRIMAKNHNLDMKICDVEYQGDGSKVTFYYTAEGRVDFRQLIKDYAGKFGVRIEMKQIGFRQEAAKVGGIGSCGRELCCSTWLTDFRSVSTAAARYQQLSINSQKLAGQCGKLKCCLNFELDSYLDALKNFPSMESRLETEKGWAHCVKIDVFKKEMWYAYDKGGIIWYKFSVEDIQEFLVLKEKGVKIKPLEELAKNLEEVKLDFIDAVDDDILERFDRKEKEIRKKRILRNQQPNQEKRTRNNLENARQQRGVGKDKVQQDNSEKTNINTSNAGQQPRKNKPRRNNKQGYKESTLKRETVKKVADNKEREIQTGDVDKEQIERKPIHQQKRKPNYTNKNNNKDKKLASKTQKKLPEQKNVNAQKNTNKLDDRVNKIQANSNRQNNQNSQRSNSEQKPDNTKE